MAQFENAILLTVLIAYVVLTLVASLVVHVRHYNPKATQWNHLNLLSAVIVVLTLCSIVPQYLLYGRSAAECRVLHHWAGSWAHTTKALAQVFFLARSNQVAGRAPPLSAAIVIIFTLNMLAFNMTVQTAVRAADGLCVVQLDLCSFMMFSFLLPHLFEVTVNARFVYYIRQAGQRVARSVGPDHAKAPKRLFRVTCAMSIGSMLVSVLCMLLVIGVVPLPRESLKTPLLVAAQVVDACSTAWPAIIIRVMKRWNTAPTSNLIIVSAGA